MYVGGHDCILRLAEQCTKGWQMVKESVVVVVVRFAMKSRFTASVQACPPCQARLFPYDTGNTADQGHRRLSSPQHQDAYDAGFGTEILSKGGGLCRQVHARLFEVTRASHGMRNTSRRKCDVFGFGDPLNDTRFRPQTYFRYTRYVGIHMSTSQTHQKRPMPPSEGSCVS